MQQCLVEGGVQLLRWLTVLIEGFQVSDIVERQRNLPVEVGDAY